MKILLGVKTLRGKGRGGSAELGRRACEEALPEAHSALRGADAVLTTLGLVTARALGELGEPPLAVAAAINPFGWGAGRPGPARGGLEELSGLCAGAAAVSSDDVLSSAPKGATLSGLMGAAARAAALAAEEILGRLFAPGGWGAGAPEKKGRGLFPALPAAPPAGAAQRLTHGFAGHTALSEDRQWHQTSLLRKIPGASETASRTMSSGWWGSAAAATRPSTT